MYELNRITISGVTVHPKGEEDFVFVKSKNEKGEPSMVHLVLAQHYYDRNAENKMGTQYFNCIGLGTIAQRLKKAITERCRLTIDGKLQARVNEKDGKKYVNTTIVIDDFQMTELPKKAN